MITPSDDHHQPASSRGGTWCAASGPIGNLLRAHHRSPSQGSSPLARHYDVLGRWFNGSPHPPVRCWSATTPWLASDSTTLSTTCRHPMPLLPIPCTTEPMDAIPASVQSYQTPLRQSQHCRCSSSALDSRSMNGPESGSEPLVFHHIPPSASLEIRAIGVIESRMAELPSMLHNRHCYCTAETCLQDHRQWRPAPVDVRRTALALWTAIKTTHRTDTNNPLANLSATA
ncbi:hypothetical protein BDP81DRAFT_103446 [Colletotrichum phormii]|uniref:Uncharacterized protein n=1 Tax=Colletotrichum phormii TaxID=359342 RepID=A0AAI9ZI04_9PEZI|nr:uncharacterized protein BDP81DRAFT_103446 [Colletotrichum phormii]KAK1624949.1 hypothetical protein BDP81DRAFT_103446 [Colletotrichum phormii]